MKFALKRDLVLALLKEDVNDPQEFFHLNKMPDIQLYEYFIDAQYITDSSQCIGIVKHVPQDCIDAQIIYDEIGIPLDLDYYLDDSKE